ncbi:unnamed protein product, partial [Darwinula stevensoni]
CALPSKYRNVSSILVQTRNFNYLLDCGKDSLYQINRIYGSFEVIKALNFIFISHSNADHLGLFQEFVLKFDFGLTLSVCGVLYCIDSCGVKVDTGDFTLAYSGDTKFDNFFVNLSMGCDLVIHESTFDDSLVERAKSTKHSTVNDALQIWKLSGAKKLVLTHFSQRYKTFFFR